MPIEFTCPHCGNHVSVADEFGGQSGPCTNCGGQITIPVVAQKSHDTSPHVQNPYATPVISGNDAAVSGKNDPALRMLIPIDRSGLAIVAGYLGLISVICFPAPIALVVGILAVRDIKRNPEKHGLGRAWFGIVMGFIFTSVLIIGLFQSIWIG